MSSRSSLVQSSEGKEKENKKEECAKQAREDIVVPPQYSAEIPTNPLMEQDQGTNLVANAPATKPDA